jgi:hypothetical protein
VTLTITIDPTWLAHPEPLGRILDQIKALESAAPWTPPPTRQPGDDEDEDLATFLDGLDAPELPPPQPARVVPSRPASSADSTPSTGKALYKWACNGKCLPELNALGKRHGFPRLVSDWSPSDVATVFDELTRPPATANGNGRPH